MNIMPEPETDTSSDVRTELCFGLLGALVVFHACLQVLTIGLSLLELRHTQLVALGVLAASLAAAVGFWTGGPWSKRNPAARAESGRIIPRLVIVAAWTLYAALIAAAYWQHDLTYDGNLYHLPTIHFWSHEGYVHWIDDGFPQSRIMNGYPKGVELLGFVLVAAFQDGNWANAANLLFLPLGVFGVACSARLLGVSRTWAAAVGALWLFIPSCILQTATTYVDNAYGSCVIAFVALTAAVVAGWKSPQPCPRWRETLVLGAAAGLCLGVKPTGIAVVGLGFLAAGALLLFRLCRQSKPPSGTTAGQAFRTLTVAAVLCCLVGGFWHVRNFIQKGSPLYPCGLTVAGWEIFPGITVQEILNPEAQTITELRGLPNYKKIFHIWRQYRGWHPFYFSVDSRVGGLGYMWLLGGLPATLIVLARFCIPKCKLDRDVFFVLLIVIGGAFLIQPANWWARFTVWIWGLGLPCFALLIDEIWPRRLEPSQTNEVSQACVPHARRLAVAGLAKVPRIWIWACLMIVLLEGVVCGLNILTGWQAKWPNRKLLARAHDLYCAPKWKLLWPEMEGTAMQRVLVGDDPVALGPFGHHPPPLGNATFLIGGLLDPFGKRSITPVEQNTDLEQVEALQRKGVRYVVWDDRYPLPPVLKRCRIEKPPGFFVVFLTDAAEGPVLEH